MADLSFRVVTPRRATAGWFRRWLLAPPPGPTMGRKRRARRARGRRIEARRNRPGLLTVAQWAAAHRTMQRQQGDARFTYTSAFYVVPTEKDARAFFDPSLGQQWEEQPRMITLVKGQAVGKSEALSQPEPQGPTDEELDAIWFAARWGRPAVEPTDD